MRVEFLGKAIRSAETKELFFLESESVGKAGSFLDYKKGREWGAGYKYS
jgi:hypothetical protein